MCHSPWSQLPLQIFLQLFLGVLLGPCLNDQVCTGCMISRSNSAQTPFFRMYFAALLADELSFPGLFNAEVHLWRSFTD
jgi:hypothetical protein